MFGENYGAFPPNTLFRFAGEKAPGEWVGPGGVRPRPRLLLVTATYRRATMSFEERIASKMTGTRASPSATATARPSSAGLNDLLATPTLTMALEFERDLEWRDWKGAAYTLRDEWAYVNGAALPKEGCTPGTRDKGNAGKTPDDFMAEVNAFIERRRAHNLGMGLHADHAYLTRDEVLAIRLYSGPAFQPINSFLREVAKLSGDYRLRLAQDPGVTFCATVQHIINAIRKLAAVVTKAEATTPLWRGVRGELPKGFWMPDNADMICGVEMGFMSTSKRLMTPLDYMADGGDNVLWAIKPMVETDDAYHCGADIAMLSQFAAEEEILFPLCTLLVVQPQSQRGQRDLATDATTSSDVVERGGDRRASAPVASLAPASAASSVSMSALPVAGSSSSSSAKATAPHLPSRQLSDPSSLAARKHSFLGSVKWTHSPGKERASRASHGETDVADAGAVAGGALHGPMGEPLLQRRLTMHGKTFQHVEVLPGFV